MAATATQEQGFTVPPGMKTPLVVSAIFHVLVLILAVTGIPYLKKPPEPMVTSIPVEILPIADMTTTNRKPVEAQPTPDKEEKTKPIQKDKPLPPKVDAVEPPKDLPKPVKEKPKPKPVVPPPPSEKLAEPDKKPPEEKPKEKPTEDQQQDFNSLLKNLQDTTPTSDEDLPQDKKADAPAPAPNAAFSEKLTMSEADALAQQLARCWNIQAGARYAEDLVVDVHLTVSPERHATSATIVDQMRYSSDSAFRAAADAAIRAVNSPLCETLILPPDKFDLWKDIIVTFDPRNMLQ